MDHKRLYRKRKATTVWPGYDQWNFDAEEGDLMIDGTKLLRLVVSNGRNKAALGELTPKRVFPPADIPGAVIEWDGERLWWCA